MALCPSSVLLGMLGDEDAGLALPATTLASAVRTAPLTITTDASTAAPLPLPVRAGFESSAYTETHTNRDRQREGKK